MAAYSIFILLAIFPPNRARNENKLNMFSTPPPPKKKRTRGSNNPLAGDGKRVLVGEYETSPYFKF